MIFINATDGRTGNQLMILAHLLASSLEYNIPFFNFGKSPDKDFILKQDRTHISLHCPLLCKIAAYLTGYSFSRKCLKLLNISTMRDYSCTADKYVPVIRQVAREKKHIIPFVWPYTDYNSLYKHQDACRNFVIPKPHYKQQAEAVIKEQRKRGGVLIGIHIRRTDYKTWFNGKYYFDLSVYEKAMQDMLRLCPEGARFIICSDEKFSSSDFSAIPENLLYFSRNPFIADFVLLASCDYIIGPPSTFSGYASFYGKVKKLTLFTSHQSIKSLEQFGVVMIDYDDITEYTTPDGEIHREYVKLSEGKIISSSVPGLKKY